ncbi:MAG: hypothetical protein RI924_1491 [Bacteroidota bacterium]|jgi:uncharacterized membrane protein (DUF485 family)
MPKYNHEQQKSLSQRFLFILGLLMFSFYLLLGLIMIFWSDMPVALSKNYRILFGVSLIVYSFFRFIRLLQPKKD